MSWGKCPTFLRHKKQNVYDNNKRTCLFVIGICQQNGMVTTTQIQDRNQGEGLTESV